MVGILVHGNNHFILSGPLPDEASRAGTGAALVHRPNWRGEVVVFSGSGQIRSKEFRENLEWAVIVPGDRETSPGVGAITWRNFQLAGVTIRRLSNGLLVGLSSVPQSTSAYRLLP